MGNDNKSAGKRLYSLDILRIISACLVIMIHCSAPFVRSFPSGSVEFSSATFFNSISRISIPLFVMISGALMLDEYRSISLSTFIIRKVLPLLVLFFAWSLIYDVIYNVLPALARGGTVDMGMVIKAFFMGHYHLWFLPMLIGKYLTVPFLRCITKSENKNLVHGFLIAAFCIKAFNSALACFPDKTVLPAALRSLSDGLEVDFFLHYTEYFVLGWYLRSFGIQEKRKRVVVYCLALASVVGMISSVILTGEYVRVYINVDIVFLFPSIALFDLVSSAKLDLSERSARNIRSLSKLTLGVYLVHPICISIFGAFVAYSAHPALYIAGFSVGVTLLSFAMSFVISRIPLLKKLIRA